MFSTTPRTTRTRTTTTIKLLLGTLSVARGQKQGKIDFFCARDNFLSPCCFDPKGQFWASAPPSSSRVLMLSISMVGHHNPKRHFKASIITQPFTRLSHFTQCNGMIEDLLKRLSISMTSVSPNSNSSSSL